MKKTHRNFFTENTLPYLHLKIINFLWIILLINRPKYFSSFATSSWLYFMYLICLFLIETKSRSLFWISYFFVLVDLIQKTFFSLRSTFIQHTTPFCSWLTSFQFTLVNFWQNLIQFLFPFLLAFPSHIIFLLPHLLVQPIILKACILKSLEAT